MRFNIFVTLSQSISSDYAIDFGYLTRWNRMIYHEKNEYESPQLYVEVMESEQGFYLSAEFEGEDAWEDEEEDEWI